MAGWKRKGGGGFLNGVTGDIVGLEFETTKFEGGRDGSYEKLSAKLTIQPDGGEEVDQYLDAGFMPDDAKIAKGKTSIDCEQGSPLLESTEFIRFVTSMVDNGLSEAELEESEGKDFSCIVGKRVTFVREKDREQQIRVGKARLAKGKDAFGKTVKKNPKPTDEEAFEAGKRAVTKGEHKGKTFDLDVLLVSAVVGDAEGGGKKGGKKKAAAAPKADTKKKAKKEEADDDGDGPSTDRADAVLVALIKGTKSGKLAKGKVAGAITRYELNDEDMTKEERDALKDLLVSDDYIEDAVKRGVVDYDEDDEEFSLPD